MSTVLFHGAVATYKSEYPPLSLCSDQTLMALSSLAKLSPPGNFVEVGVYQGGSALYLYQVACEQHRKIYLYDTFNGIPYQSPVDRHEPGHFHLCNADEVRRIMPKAVVVEGVFPESALMDMGPISFAHLDCDQYQSYRDAIGFLRPRMVKNGIMWFDDSPCLEGALKAVTEFFPKETLTLTESGQHYIQL